MNDRVQYTKQQVREKLAELKEKKHELPLVQRIVAEAIDKAVRLALKYIPEAFKDEEENDDDKDDKKNEDEKPAEKPDEKKTLTEQQFEEISNGKV